jgi:hypothetical protein
MAVAMNVTVFWYVRSCSLESAAHNYTVPVRRKVAGRNLFSRQQGELPTKKKIRLQ